MTKILLRTTPKLHRNIVYTSALVGMSMNVWIIRTLRETVKEK